MAVTERADGITVIDDAYNANPESMRAGLEALSKFAGGRRSVAIIGEMRELGPRAEHAHGEVGQLAAEQGIDKLVVIGQGARSAHDEASGVTNWHGSSVFVPDLDAARSVLPGILLPGDVVLVKASNGSKLWVLADELNLGEHGPASN
jgi:UDP-N-acetylmuramoyl-tripeptide--D-alanyl-D-alanine ligase